MRAFAVSFGVVFAAELGDKSQFLALAFATRYRTSTVLAGVALAAAVLHGIAVAAGASVSAVLSGDATQAVAGVLFLAAATVAWRADVDAHGEGDVLPVARSGGAAVARVTGAFLAAEVGDKTMLATLALAAASARLATWAGAVTAMVASAALAVAVGRRLSTALPEAWLRRAAVTLFAVFGIALLVDAAT